MSTEHQVLATIPETCAACFFCGDLYTVDEAERGCHDYVCGLSGVVILQPNARQDWCPFVAEMTEEGE